MKTKRGFTIIELMLVVGILAILITIVVVAASGVQKASREKRAIAMASALEQALGAYYAQEGSWPNTIENKTKSMTEDAYTFTASETDTIFREVVGKAFGKGSGQKSMLIDATGLYVINTTRTGNGGKGCNDNHGKPGTPGYCGNQRCQPGLDFSEAVKKGNRHVSLSQMSFGYPGKENGKFCRYKITYNGKTDSVTVSR